jgi:hypothetical protein
MDLSQVFSEGQAYVALSRARTLDGMEVMAYNLQKIRASVWRCRLTLSNPRWNRLDLSA